MSILNEAARTAAEEKVNDDLDVIYEEQPEDPSADPRARLEDFLPDLSVLAAKTGEGSIEDYIDHPLNAKGSRGMAQMIRGFTGMAGQLDYAIIDIALGAFQYAKEGKSLNASESEQ